MSKGKRTRAKRSGPPTPKVRGKSQVRIMLERELAAKAPPAGADPDVLAVGPTCEPGAPYCPRLALYRVGRSHACDKHVKDLRAARYKREVEVAIWKANPRVYWQELRELAGEAPLVDVLERQLAGVA